MPDELSQGQRKLVGVARALAAEPELVLHRRARGRPRHDRERGARPPAAPLIDAGITILLVDHDMGLVLNVATTSYVIEFGQVIAEGTPAEIRRDPVVIAAYLGQRRREADRRSDDPGGVDVSDPLLDDRAA